MPATLTYPGVYVQEVPSSVRTITGVATSITAFIGRAARGPVNQPVTINSFADFERTFGGLWKDSYLGFAVQDFYLNGGGQAIIVRVQKNGVCAQMPANLTLTAITTGTAGNNLAVTIKHYDDTDQGAITAAKSYGLTVSDLFGLTVVDTTAPQNPKFQQDYLTVKDPTLTVAQSPRIDLVLQSQKTPVLKVTGLLPIVIPDVANNQKLSGGSDKEPAKIELKIDPNFVILPLIAASEGVWGNNLQITITQNNPADPVAQAIAAQYGLAVTDFFNLTVIDKVSLAVEQFNNLTVKPSPQKVDQVLLNQSNLVRINGILPGVVPSPISAVMLGSGNDGNFPDDAAILGDENKKTGLYALEQISLFNLLCIPPYLSGPDLVLTDPQLLDVSDSVLIAAAAYCQKRRAFFIIDAPAEWTIDNAVNSIANFPVRGDAAAYAAIYFPWVTHPNPLKNNQLQTFVPCGMVAGKMASTDTQRGVWKAPAGTESGLLNITQLETSLNDANIGSLNPLGINCLRNLPAAGPVIWGARTLQGNDRLASQWKYIPVRRLASFIEESLYRGTQWVVFEPNDEPLWSQIRLNVGTFMNQLFRQGAFQGSTPQQAYFVKCDSDTTTQADINNGIVNVLVGFAPLKPAEFVVISIQQIVGNL